MCVSARDIYHRKLSIDLYSNKKNSVILLLLLFHKKSSNGEIGARFLFINIEWRVFRRLRTLNTHFDEVKSPICFVLFYFIEPNRRNIYIHSFGTRFRYTYVCRE